MRPRLPDGWGPTATLSTRPFNVAGNLASVIGLLIAVANELAWETSAVPLAYLCLLSLYLLARYIRQERWAR